MADFTVFIPNDFVPLLTNRVTEHCTAFETTAAGQKLLTYYGKPNVAALTAAEKAQFSCQIHLWKLYRDWHVSDEINTARTAAEQAADDVFNP